MTRPQPAIAVTGLRKSFGDQLVLDGIDLDVADGAIFALLGPNGAGKTTMVQILTTLIGADAGAVRVAGHDLAAEPDAVRAAIGVTGQFSAVDNLLTGEENLILMADLHRLGRREGRRRASALLERFDLVDAAAKPVATYSGGMRRRLDLAMGLVGDPRMVSKSGELASNLPMPLMLLPFLGSGFVPTDSMPGALRWFAEYQPFTPVMDTVRGLLMGTAIGHSGVLAVAWSAGIALAGYLWATRLFNRDPTP